MAYVDGFVIPVPKNKITDYLKLARTAGAIWKEHGALDYKECAGDDLAVKGFTPFTKGIGAKPNETVVFSWIVFKSKAHRNSVNKKVMADPRLADCGASMPFDCKRMLYGGFKVIVDA